VHHRPVTLVVWCAIAFQIRHSRPLQLRSRWRTRHCPVHTKQSGAPCRPLVRAMRRPRIARPTVVLSTADCAADRCAVDRWLTGQSGAPPDSPVNYSHTLLVFSRERTFHRRPVWRTGHCPVHHWTLSGVPD
jgi:hypothetical protein